MSILFERLASGLTLDETLAEIPTVERAAAIAALQQSQVQLSQFAARRADESRLMPL